MHSSTPYSGQPFFQSDSFDKIMRDAIDRAIASSPVIVFTKAMQMEMLRVDPKMPPREAWAVAQNALRDFLHTSQIKFGDERFDWSEDAAVEIIHEMEIEHWEPQP
jgi:hypothetical protein